MQTTPTQVQSLQAPTSGSGIAAAIDISPGGRRADPHLEESPRPPEPPTTLLLSHFATLPLLSDSDRSKLSLLFRARGDPVSFAALREEDPLEILVWLCQPHIKPWHDAIRNAHRDHEQTETHLSLARALRDITRILDLEADSKLRIRAVNAIIKLANAIHRGSKHPNFRTGLDWAQQANRRHQTDGRLFPTPPNEAAALATEAVRADTAAGDALLSLNLHAQRRAHRDANLEDAKAPPGARPVQRVTGPRDILAPTTASPTDAISPIGPIGPTGLTPPPTYGRAPNHLNGTHRNGPLTARAGTPRPPTDSCRRRGKRRHRR